MLAGWSDRMLLARIASDFGTLMVEYGRAGTALPVRVMGVVPAEGHLGAHVLHGHGGSPLGRSLTPHIV